MNSKHPPAAAYPQVTISCTTPVAATSFILRYMGAGYVSERDPNWVTFNGHAYNFVQAGQSQDVPGTPREITINCPELSQLEAWAKYLEKEITGDDKPVLGMRGHPTTAKPSACAIFTIPGGLTLVIGWNHKPKA